ncbi:S8 family serine peptidase [Flavihumibacter sp. UBA7668]|uniref:S8 family serine peptidase n=1 Tax=Flavihumibacter sp. UBA7668 TaxID=1946542 RepID=UPI0025B8F4C9|nr:S8 family serine peptidase [Flavihumibacter sp. UBA7668]
MPKPLLFVRVLLTVLSFNAIGQAQTPAGGTRPVLFKEPTANQRFAMLSPVPFRLGKTGIGNNRQVFFLKFRQIPGPVEKKHLSAKGIALHEYIPSNVYLATVANPLTDIELKSLGIIGVFEPPSSIKQEKEIYSVRKVQAASEKNNRKFHVWLAPGMDSVSALQKIQNLLGKDAPLSADFKILYNRMLEIRLSEASLEELLTQPFVLYAMPVPELFALNIIGTESHFGNLIHQGNASTPGLTGKGITVGIGDAGRIYHIDHNYYEDGQLYNGSFHATHVAGTLAGKGHVNPIMRGFAYDARLEVEYFNNIIFQTPALYNQKRMVITNNSYGAGSFCLPYSGQYSGFCGQADQQLLDMPHLMHVFAAGNTGTLTCGNYPVSYRTIDNAFQAAKNVITVGGTNESGSTSVYSKGPTLDGRVKPEIVAISTNVLSTGTNNGYGRLDGTSMSSPQVSGALALLYERYRQLNNANDPDGALMKALVCNTATDIGTRYVDFANGFGWLNIKKAVETLNKKSWFSGTIEHQEDQVFEINLEEEVADFKILLYWHDLPASYYSSKALVNDLDLTVQLPDGSVYEPFVLDTSAAGVLNQATRGKDHLNNIEQVVIDRALPGRYQIRIKGFELPFGSQSFKVVYNWEDINFELIQPAGGELFKHGQRRIIQWRYPTHESDEFGFFYSTNGGLNWNEIPGSATEIGRKNWTLPGFTNSNVLLKITHPGSGQERISAPFSVLPEMNFTVSSECESSITVEWKKPSNLDSIAILLYNGTEMETIAFSSDSVYKIQGLKTGKPYWVSLQPILNQKIGERSIAKRILTRPVICSTSGLNEDLSIAVSDSFLVSRNPSVIDSIAPFTVQVRNEGTTSISDTVYLKLLKNNNEIGQDTLVRTWVSGQTYNWVTRLRPTGIPGESAYYQLAIFKRNDPDPSNDSAAIFWRYLQSDPVELPFTESLQQLKDTIYKIPGYSGLAGLPAWDAQLNSPAINLEARNSDGIFITSKIEGQSIQLIGNYNFTNYNVMDDIRMSLDIPDFSQVKMDCFIRGNDTSSWIGVALLDPFTQQPKIDFLNISNLLANAGQEFSSSFQIRFRIVHSSYQNILNVFRQLRFFKAEEDISLIYLTYQKQFTTDGDSLQFRLWARNNKQVSSAAVQFSIQPPDGNLQYLELPSIPAGDTAILGFTVDVNDWPNAVALVKAWVHTVGDLNLSDDSLVAALTYVKKINSFPYREGFESGKAGWGSTFLYEHSSNLSESIAPFKPANGNSFWGTQWIASTQGIGFIVPSGYLLSPLFDLNGMKQPYISASVNKQLCESKDSVFLEYSIDTGKIWIPLIAQSDQVNWYNNPDRSAWLGCDQPGFDRWRVISSKLPEGISTIQFRLLSLARNDTSNVMPRLPGGFLLDDFHLYNRVYPLFMGNSHPVQNIRVGSSNFSPVLASGQLLAELKCENNEEGPISITYSQTEGTLDFSGNEVLPLNWTLNSSGQAGVKKGIARFYLPDEKIQNWLDAHPCDTCSQKLSAYDLSIFRYGGPPATLNNRLSDNVSGYETVWDPSGFDLIPYDKGYFVELPTTFYGEFYLGRNTTLSPLDFNAVRSDNENAVNLNWSVVSWQGIELAELERSTSSDRGFLPILRNVITPTSELSAVYSDTDIIAPGTYFYRLKLVGSNGTIRYSAIRVVQFEKELNVQIYPNPGRGDQIKLQLNRLDGARLHLELTDIGGKRLANSAVTVGVGQHWMSLAPLTRGLPAGVYVVGVSTGKQKKTVRLVISGN